mgnify:CR=1 FL=1
MTPVLIIGGFTSVPGAIVGGLIVGAGEKLAERYLGEMIGGGIEYWFAYVLALAVLVAVLAVAVPAVFGYNILLKRNKAIQDVLREFTGDLEAYLIGGVRPELGHGAARPAAPAAKK